MLEKEEYMEKEKILNNKIASLKIQNNQIKVVLTESEEKWEITRNPTKQWLYRLKLYSADVEDLCEEYDYEIFHLRQHDHSMEYKVCHFLVNKILINLRYSITIKFPRPKSKAYTIIND